MTTTTTHPATVLVIEDDDASRMLVTYLLEAAGHRVLAAENGAVGLDMALAEGPDIVLCDLQMPVMGVIDATRAIRADSQNRQTPILAMTANAFDEDRNACLEAGMNDHIGKPIDSDNLARVLLSWLDKTLHRDAG